MARRRIAEGVLAAVAVAGALDLPNQRIAPRGECARWLRS
jgi:hypothetical protein